MIGEWQNAAEAFQHAIELNPEFVWSHYNLAEVLMPLNSWQDAANAYRQILKIDPNNTQVPPRLCEVLEHLLKDDPRNIHIYLELGHQLLAQDKYAEGVGAYQMALQIAPCDENLSATIANKVRVYDPNLADKLQSRAEYISSRLNISLESSNLNDFNVVKALITQSHLFDDVYYQLANPVQGVKGSLLDHYLNIGSDLGYQPNPLFDASYYQAYCPEIVDQQINPLAHYYRIGYGKGYNPHPYFCNDFYLLSHPEVAAAGLNPLEHYLAYGAQEGRVAFSVANAQKILTSPISKDAEYLKCWYKNNSVLSSIKTVGIYCNSQGNYFITEIADFIADALSHAGHNTVRLSEQDEISASLDQHWVIAPHEFFYLGEGHQWGQHHDWLKKVVMINVEQPQTTWFSKAFHFMRHAPIIFDINVKSAEMLCGFGLPAYWLPLGHLSGYEIFESLQHLSDLQALRGLTRHIRDHTPALQSPLSTRPLDIHFIGTLNPRREEFFATNASWLSQYQNFFHIPPMGIPLIQGEGQALDTKSVVGISRRSKILLNIHRDDLTYFEWHRLIFHGLWQNTLVVTEPCHAVPGLIAGEHYIECSLSEMKDMIQWLLSTQEGMNAAEEIRQAGHQTFIREFSGPSMMIQALSLVEQSAFKETE